MNYSQTSQQQQQACIQCAGLSFSKDEFGFLECDNCHTRVEGYFTQEVEQFENGGGYKTGSYKRVMTQELLDAMNKKKYSQKDNRYYILQNLLKLQVTTLIKEHGYNERLYQVSGELWFKLLDKFSNNSNDEDDDENSNSETPFGIINYPPPYLTLAVCYLSCLYLKEPIIISDLLALAQSGKIPTFTNETTWRFAWSNNMSTFSNFEKICIDLCKYLNFLPNVNIPLILLRFCNELRLPKFILNLSNQLYNIITVPFKVYLKSQPDIHLHHIYEKILLPTNSDLLCASIILIVLKSKLNLFDNQYNNDQLNNSNNNSNSNGSSNNNNDNSDNSSYNNNNNTTNINCIKDIEFLEKLLKKKNSKYPNDSSGDNNLYSDSDSETENEADREEGLKYDSKDLERIEVESWLYDIMFNLPKNQFISKQDTWSLNIDDFKGLPKSRPTSLKRLVTDQIYEKYDGLSERYQKKLPSMFNNKQINSSNTSNQNSNLNLLNNQYQSNLKRKKVSKSKSIIIPKVRLPPKSINRNNINNTIDNSIDSNSMDNNSIDNNRDNNNGTDNNNRGGIKNKNNRSINTSNGLDYYYWLISILQKIIYRQHRDISLFLNNIEQIYINQVRNLSSRLYSKKDKNNNNNDGNNSSNDDSNVQYLKLNLDIELDNLFKKRKAI